MKRLLSVTSVVLLTATLAACGGGGGGGGGGTTPDTTAPTVSATTPVSNATGVAVNTVITAEFSEAMNQSTLTTANFLVSSASGSSVPGTVAPSSLEAAFTPSSGLDPGTKYSATITTGVKDLAGNALASDYTWTFTTLATGPTATHGRVNSDTPANYPANQQAVAFNNAGLGIAVWTETASSGSGGYRLLYAKYNSTWSAETELDVSVGNIYGARIATDGSGFMLVYNKRSRIYGILFDSSGNPGSPSLISTATSYTPDIASGGTGKYAAAWTGYDSVAALNRTFASIYSSGAWQTPVPASNTLGNTDYPHIASNGTDYAVTWAQNDISVNKIYANVSSGGTWTTTTAMLIEGNAGNAYYPVIASNGTDFAVTWYQSDGTYNNIYANISSGGTWTTTTAALVEGSAGNAYYPSIASNGIDYAVTWHQSDGTYNSIYANISSSGTWTTTTAALVEGSAGNAYYAAITSNGSDYAVTWTQYDNSAGRYKVYANVFSALTSTTKDAAARIDNGAGNPNYPIMVPNGTGFAALWEQSNSSSTALGGNSIYANLYSGSWGSATDLVQTAYRGASQNPVMATNKYGETLAVWSQYDTGNGLVYGRIMSSGAWGQPFVISQYLTGFGVDVATNGTDFMVAYSRQGAVTARTCDRSGNLGTEYGLRDPGNTASVYVFKAASNGAGYAVAWLQNYNGYPSVYANIYTGPATTWAGASLLETLNTYANTPLVMASNGTDYAVTWWQGDGAGSYHVYANMSNGASWGSATVLDNSTYAVNPAIASNGASFAVVWQDARSGVVYDMYANIFSSLTAATKDGEMLLENSSYFVNTSSHPAIASNGSDYAAAWVQPDGSYDRIYTNVFSSLTATTRDAAVAVSTGVYNASNPSIASDSSGYAVVWVQSDGTANSIYESAYGGTVWSGQTLLESDNEPADSPFITSNGNTYSAIWRKQDTADTLVYDIWVKTGF